MYTPDNGFDPEKARRDDEWTPAAGLWRGTQRGLVAAVLLALLLIPLAGYLPLMLIIVWLRAPLAFALGWLLCGVVQRAAGMGAGRWILLGLGLAVLVLASNHVVFALHGVPACEGGYWWAFPANILEGIFPSRGDVLMGWTWFHPYVLLALNAAPLAIGGAFCAALSARG